MISERTSPDKWTVFATIDVSCRRSAVGEYEIVIQAEMNFGLKEDLSRLSAIEDDILKKYRALEPTVTTTTTQRVSRALAALLASGGGSGKATRTARSCSPDEKGDEVLQGEYLVPHRETDH